MARTKSGGLGCRSDLILSAELSIDCSSEGIADVVVLTDLSIFSPRFYLINVQPLLIVAAWLLACSAAQAGQESQVERLPAELLVRLEDALAERNTDLKARQDLIAELDLLLDNSHLPTDNLPEIRIKVRYLEALTNFRLSHWDLCESQLGQLRSTIDPQAYPELSFNCRSLQAAVMLMKGRSEEGQRALEELLATDISKIPATQVYRARINHAFALDENGRFDEAVVQYERIMFKAIEQHHDLPAIQAGNNLLSILVDNEDLTAARQVLAELEPITSRNPKTIGTLAIELQRRVLQYTDGDLDGALQGLEDLIEHRELPPVILGRAHKLCATVLERKGALDDAIRHMKIAFEVLGNSPTEKMECHVVMARLLLQKEDYDGVLNELADENDGRVTPALKKQIYQLKLESSLRKNGQDEEANWVGILLEASEDRETRSLKIIAKDFEQQLALVKKAAADQQRQAVTQAAAQSDRLQQDRVYFFSALLATCGLGAGGLAVVHLRRRAERRKLSDQLALNAKLESLVEARTLELKENLAVQAELTQALERKKRIETVGLLAGNVAHDINNLLQVIANANQTLADRESTEQSRDQAMHISNESLLHGAGIITQILAYSRQQTLSAKSIRLGELLSSSRALFQSAIGETITLRIEDNSQDAHVFVDPSQLTTALLNLLTNAADAMANGGTITIEATLAGPIPLHSSMPQKGEYVYLAVKDTGTGFQPEDLARAFEPFFSTKRVGDGTGLGLSSVKSFINRSGGDMRIESSPGAGACVQIWLPRHEARAATRSPSPPPISDSYKGKRLLLVEDHPNVAKSIMILLRQLSLEVVWSASGDEAAALLRQDSGFDFVLSDIRMPGQLDGVQLARWIGSTYPQLPVVLMSGYSDVAVEGLSVPFLQKPFKPDELKDILRKLLENS